MGERLNINSGSSWEDIIGYSRAVRIGNIIEVAGTIAVDSGNEVVGKNDVYAQTKFILKKIENAPIFPTGKKSAKRMVNFSET